MRRREFIAALGGAAAWPLAARAQQGAMPVIGFFHLTLLETTREYLAAFYQGLSDSGYVDNRNVAIEYRWAQGQNDRLPTLAAELVRRQVSVIVVLESTHGALSAKAATQVIPVVFMQGADPVASALLVTLTTGWKSHRHRSVPNPKWLAKRFQQLLELLPAAEVDRLPPQPTNPVFAETETREVQLAADGLGVRLLFENASRRSELEPAFASIVQQRADALLRSGDGLSSDPPRPNHRACRAPCHSGGLFDARVRRVWRSHELWHELS